MKESPNSIGMFIKSINIVMLENLYLVELLDTQNIF